MGPISVIIPCYNEAEAIQTTLMRVLQSCWLDTPPNIFIVDAGGADETEAVVRSVGDKYPGLISYACLESPSRGRQFCCGATMAKTPYLLFLHADTLLPMGWDAAIVDFFTTQRDVQPLLGCFELALPPPLRLSLRIMLWTANMRAKMGKLP
jgi:glycosyltransferase involved in cell wall biosynthesis